jgi:hypothetical protein
LISEKDFNLGKSCVKSEAEEAAVLSLEFFLDTEEKLLFGVTKRAEIGRETAPVSARRRGKLPSRRVIRGVRERLPFVHRYREDCETGEEFDRAEHESRFSSVDGVVAVEKIKEE